MAQKRPPYFTKDENRLVEATLAARLEKGEFHFLNRRKEYEEKEASNQKRIYFLH